MYFCRFRFLLLFLLCKALLDHWELALYKYCILLLLFINKMNYVALTQRIKICLIFPCIPICGHNLKKRKYIKTNITIKIDLFIHGGGEENGAVAQGGYSPLKVTGVLVVSFRGLNLSIGTA